MVANLSQWVLKNFLSITLRVIFSGSERDSFDIAETIICFKVAPMPFSLLCSREDEGRKFALRRPLCINDIGIILMPEEEINNDFHKRFLFHFDGSFENPVCPVKMGQTD